LQKLVENKCFSSSAEGIMPERFTISQQQYLAQRLKLFVLQIGILYRFGQDNKFCCVLQLEEVPTILQWSWWRTFFLRYHGEKDL